MGDMQKRTEGLASWLVLLQAHSVVTEGLSDALEAAGDLPLGWFEVLVFLGDRPDGRMKMQELADQVLLSKSGVTRLVDRMEEAGLVRRASCDSDRRVTYAEITPAGRRALREAVPVHAAALEERFLGILSSAELRQLRNLLRKVLAANGASERTCPSLAAPAQTRAG
jgi:DNA-binding MarR family transcriptional regulator